MFVDHSSFISRKRLKPVICRPRNSGGYLFWSLVSTSRTGRGLFEPLKKIQSSPGCKNSKTGRVSPCTLKAGNFHETHWANKIKTTETRAEPSYSLFGLHGVYNIMNANPLLLISIWIRAVYIHHPPLNRIYNLVFGRLLMQILLYSKPPIIKSLLIRHTYAVRFAWPFTKVLCLK